MIRAAGALYRNVRACLWTLSPCFRSVSMSIADGARQSSSSVRLCSNSVRLAGAVSATVTSGFARQKR